MSRRSNILLHVLDREAGSLQKPHGPSMLKRYAEDAICKPVTMTIVTIDSSIANPRATFLAVFSADGKQLATTHADHSVRVWTMPEMKESHRLVAHRRTPWSLAFHPAHPDLLATGCLNGQVRIWDLRGGGWESWQCPENATITSMTFHPTRRLLLFANRNMIFVWEWEKGEPTVFCQTPMHGERVRWVKFDPSGEYLFTGIVNMYLQDDLENIRDANPWLKCRVERRRPGDSRRGGRRAAMLPCHPNPQLLWAPPETAPRHPQAPLPTHPAAPPRGQAPAVGPPRLGVYSPPPRPAANQEEEEEYWCEEVENGGPSVAAGSSGAGSVPASSRPRDGTCAATEQQHQHQQHQHQQQGSYRSEPDSQASVAGNNSSNSSSASLPTTAPPSVPAATSGGTSSSGSCSRPGSGQGASAPLETRRAVHPAWQARQLVDFLTAQTRARGGGELEDAVGGQQPAGTARGASLSGSGGAPPPPPPRSVPDTMQGAVPQPQRPERSEGARQASAGVAEVQREGLATGAGSVGLAAPLRPGGRGAGQHVRGVGRYFIQFSSTSVACGIERHPGAQPPPCSRAASAFRREQLADSRTVGVQVSASDIDAPCVSSAPGPALPPCTTAAPVRSRESLATGTASSCRDPLSSADGDRSNGAEQHRLEQQQQQQRGQGMGSGAGSHQSACYSGANSAAHAQGGSSDGGSAGGGRADDAAQWKYPKGKWKRVRCSSDETEVDSAKRARESSSGEMGEPSASVSQNSTDSAFRPPPGRSEQGAAAQTSSATAVSSDRGLSSGDGPARGEGAWGPGRSSRHPRPVSNLPFFWPNSSHRIPRITITRPRDGAPGAENRTGESQREQVRGTGPRLHERFACIGTGESAVVINISRETHRIQRWKFDLDDPPDLSQRLANVLVLYCKLHNDASTCMSADGTLLAVLLPLETDYTMTYSLTVISLRPHDLGTPLYVHDFGPNVVSVSISPLNQYVLVGLIAPRSSEDPRDRKVACSIYMLQKPDGSSSSMEHVRTLYQPGFHVEHVSVNLAAFLPTPGSGLLIGMNQSHLLLVRPHYDGCMREDAETEMRLPVPRELPVRDPRTLHTCFPVLNENVRTVATQTLQSFLLQQRQQQATARPESRTSAAERPPLTLHFPCQAHSQ